MESQGHTQEPAARDPLQKGPSEERLVEKARMGDRGAFEELVERHRSSLVALIDFQLREPLRQKVEIDDVLQETLLRACQAIRNFQWQDEGSFSRWLGGIARNVILKLVSRHKLDKAIALDRDVPASDTTLGKALRREERFDRLRTAMEKLSPDHRQVLLMARIEKLPIKRIAERLHRSPDAVSHLLMRAVEKLKAAFGETESFSLPDRLLTETDQGNGARDEHPPAERQPE